MLNIDPCPSDVRKRVLYMLMVGYCMGMGNPHGSWVWVPLGCGCGSELGIPTPVPTPTRWVCHQNKVGTGFDENYPWNRYFPFLMQHMLIMMLLCLLLLDSKGCHFTSHMQHLTL